MIWKILLNFVTLGVPAIVEAVSKARRKKREQQARLEREKARLEGIARRHARKVKQ